MSPPTRPSYQHDGNDSDQQLLPTIGRGYPDEGAGDRRDGRTGLAIVWLASDDAAGVHGAHRRCRVRALAARMPPIPWPTCRSSTRCCLAGSRRRSCPHLPGAGRGRDRLRRARAWAARRHVVDAGRQLPSDIRARMPRFRPENLEHNLALVDALRPIAEEKGATVAQLAIAWVLSRGEDIVPLVGTTRRDRLDEAIGAVDLELTQDDLAAIERAMPTGAAAGERYDERQMAMLDSEQRRPPRPSHRPSAR